MHSISLVSVIAGMFIHSDTNFVNASTHWDLEYGHHCAGDISKWIPRKDNICDQVYGNLQKCVWYANLRVGRASYANLRITLKSALVWVWMVIDRKSSSDSSHDSVGTSLDVSPHISGNKRLSDATGEPTKPNSSSFFCSCMLVPRAFANFIQVIHLIAWPRVRIEL